MLDHALVSRFVFSVHFPYYQLRITSYDDFSKDTEVTGSILARIASYLVSLLDAGKSSPMARSIISLVGALSCNSTPAFI